MNITPVSNPVATGDPQIERINTRRIVMQTNRTTPSMPPSIPPPIPATEASVDAGNNIGINQSDADEDTKPLSPQYAALAKQRRALQVKERELAEKERAMSETNKGWIDPALIKSQPLRVLLENGVTYDQLAQEITNNPVNNEVQELRREIQALKSGVDSKFETSQQEQEKAALTQMRREADVLVKDPEFELVQATRSVPHVIRLIEAHYRKSGEVLDVRAAMKMVEDQLLEDNLRVARSQKIQTALAPKEQPPAPAPKTLTSRNSASPQMSAKQRAIAAFYGTLNK